jgi:hypothetical protein
MDPGGPSKYWMKPHWRDLYFPISIEPKDPESPQLCLQWRWAQGKRFKAKDILIKSQEAFQKQFVPLTTTPSVGK